MTEAYNDALSEQLEKNIWDELAEEASSMTPGEYATTAADIVGIFDPTPVSDAVGGLLSLVRGDFLGAGLSVVGMVPYVGDLGKIGKIGKLAPRTARALETMLRRSDELASAGRATLKQVFKLDQVAAARRAAAERVRKAMLQARKGNVNCKDCKKLRGPAGESRQLQMPRNGTSGNWRGGGPDANGNGMFEFAEPKSLPDGRVVDTIEYRNGFPNFDEYVQGSKHDLWEVTGDAKGDASSLKKLMRETDPSWRPPSKSDYTLHHFEDGQVGYVPKNIHDRTTGGAAHTGGNSMVNNELF